MGETGEITEHNMMPFINVNKFTSLKKHYDPYNLDLCCLPFTVYNTHSYLSRNNGGIRENNIYITLESAR